jgi:hypothetical protein
MNLFGDHPDDPERPGIGRIDDVAALAIDGCVIVAMGQKVARGLEGSGIPFRVIRHPAARGAGRRRDLYEAHVREILA